MGYLPPPERIPLTVLVHFMYFNKRTFLPLPAPNSHSRPTPLMLDTPSSLQQSTKNSIQSSKIAQAESTRSLRHLPKKHPEHQQDTITLNKTLASVPNSEKTQGFQIALISIKAPHYCCHWGFFLFCLRLPAWSLLLRPCSCHNHGDINTLGMTIQSPSASLY